jgi:hypothetical protein
MEVQSHATYIHLNLFEYDGPTVVFNAVLSGYFGVNRIQNGQEEEKSSSARTNNPQWGRIDRKL